MAIIRLQDNTPAAYVENSRDFQLVCRAYDVALNGVKFYSDSILDLSDTSQINNALLPLLQTKVGFYTLYSHGDRELKHALRAFPYIMKNKGSLEAINMAIRTWLKAERIYTSYSVELDHDEKIVKVNFSGRELDTSLLEELFRYILPFGWLVQFGFFASKDLGETNIFLSNSKSSISTRLIPLDSYQIIGSSKVFAVTIKAGNYKLSLQTIPHTDNPLVFTYDESTNNWELDGASVNLSSYGIGAEGDMAGVEGTYSFSIDPDLIEGEKTMVYTDSWSENPVSHGVTVGWVPQYGDEITISDLTEFRGLVGLESVMGFYPDLPPMPSEEQDS